MANLSGTVIPLPTPFDERGEVDEKVVRSFSTLHARGLAF